MRVVLAAILSCVVSAAAASDATVTEGNTLSAPPAGWIGPVPHLVIMGAINGRPVDVQYLDVAKASGIAAFEGKREYLPGDAGAWRYGDFEIALKAMIDGVEKSVELEFENHDFSQHPLPASFMLQDTEFPQGLLSNLEAQLEWETPEATVNDEVGGWAGVLTLTLDSGTPDAKNLLPDGMIGGHVLATRGEDRLVVSFTVPVTEYELDD